MRRMAAGLVAFLFWSTGSASAIDLPGRSWLEAETFPDARAAVDRARTLTLEFPQAAVVAMKGGRFAVVLATVPTAQASGAAAELTGIGRTGPVRPADGRSYGAVIFGPDPTTGLPTYSVGFPTAPAASEGAPYLQIGAACP